MRGSIGVASAAMAREGRGAYAAAPVAVRSERFRVPVVDGLALHTLHHGDPSAPPLVLLHGGAANAHWWDHLAPALAQHFHVVALDFRGHGDSDHPDALKVGGFSDDLDALLSHLGAPDAILVGHSLGARVALERAARVLPRGLALIDLAHGAAPAKRDAVRRAFGIRRSYRTREEAVARFRFLPPAPHVEESLRRAIAEHSVQEEPDGRFGFKFDPRWFGLPSRPLPSLARVVCPTLILRGSESALLTPEGAADLVAQLPAARAVEIAGAGHHVHLDRPAETLHALLAFLVEAR